MKIEVSTDNNFEGRESGLAGQRDHR